MKSFYPPKRFSSVGVAVVAMTGLLEGGGLGQDDAAPLVAKPIALETSETDSVEVVTEQKPGSAVAAASFTVQEPEAAPVPVPKAPADYRSTRSLAEMANEGKSVMLKNVMDSRRLRIPIPWRAKWPELRIDLQYENSAALDVSRSQLELRWEGDLVTQRALSGDVIEGNLMVGIPNRDLRPGAHPLEVRVLQQAGDGNRDPFSEDLWTRIDLSASTLTLDHRLKSLSPVLSDLPRLLDPMGWDPFQLRLVTAESWALTEIHLEWISRVVERSALMLDSVPLVIENRPSLDVTGDHLVVGLRDEIAPLLPEAIASAITESFIGIFPHPEDDRFFVTVVAGGTREGMEKAVRVFAATEFSLPPIAMLDLSRDALPVLPPGPPMTVMSPGEERTFLGLGQSTWKIQGLATERARVPVHLPPGMENADSAKVKLRLDMAWSPVRKDATLDVFVNGARQVTVPIGKAEERRFDGYELELPLAAFRSGKNEIGFQPHLIPPRAGEGKPVNWDSLQFVIDGRSRVRLPAVDREIRLPDLALTARSGIPAVNIGSVASPQGFRILLTERDYSDLSAGCTVLAKFAQVAHRRIPLGRLSFELPPAESNYVVVGSEAGLPDDLVPSATAFRFQESERLVVAQFESPLKEGRLGMAIVSAVDANLSESVRGLIEPAQWAQLSGDRITWSGGDGSFQTSEGNFGEVTIYHEESGIGQEGGERGGVSWVVYLLAILLLVGGGITFYLRRERLRRQLPGQVSIDAPMWSFRGGDHRI